MLLFLCVYMWGCSYWLYRQFYVQPFKSILTVSQKKKNQVLCISWHNLIRLAVEDWSGAQCSGACQHVQGAVSHPEHRRRQQQLLCQACESQKRPCRPNKTKPENKQNHTEKFHVKWNFHEFLFYHTFKNATVWLDRFDSPVDLHTSQISLGNGEAEASTFKHMYTAHLQHQNSELVK